MCIQPGSAISPATGAYDTKNALAKSTAQASRIAEGEAEAYKPSVLADYLFQTAQLYSSFYQSSPILKSEPEVRAARLRLCVLFGKILSAGLGLLGIDTPRHI